MIRLYVQIWELTRTRMFVLSIAVLLTYFSGFLFEIYIILVSSSSYTVQSKIKQDTH